MIRKIVAKLKLVTQKRGLKFILPTSYLIGLLISFILFPLTYIFPFLTVSISGGWIDFGLPLGLIIALFLSWPGYLAAAIMLAPGRIQVHGTALLVLMEFLISIFFYYILGLFLDFIMIKVRLSKN